MTWVLRFLFAWTMVSGIAGVLGDMPIVGSILFGAGLWAYCDFSAKVAFNGCRNS